MGGREVVHAAFIGTDKGHEREERCRAFRWKTGWKRAVKVSDDTLMWLLEGQRGAEGEEINETQKNDLLNSHILFFIRSLSIGVF